MFESAELGHSITRQSYQRAVPRLRAGLLDAQYDLLEAGRFAVLVLVNGMDGAGKGDTVNKLNEWLDPRHVVTHAFDAPGEEERLRPPMWRYWRNLAPRGRIGVLFNNWYFDAIQGRLEKTLSRAGFDERLAQINRFERMLANEGTLLVKLWFHLSKPAQKARFEHLESDPDTAWRVTRVDWKQHKRYDRLCDLAEHALRHTSKAHAPWTVVEGVDARYRAVTTGRVLLAALRERLDGAPPTVEPQPAPRALVASNGRDVLGALTLRKSLSEADYDEQLERWQGELARLTRHKRFAERSLVGVFEGMDAAGKGGAIRRVTAALDARRYRVVPIAAPTDEERAHPYLWRFWNHVPRRGKLTLFDRSWYGRVLVERVEGYCSEADWMRAFDEINEFEDELIAGGAVVVKLWLAVSLQEQMKRFKAREATGFKRYKITPDDWRNRDKWPAYEQAACDMFERTGTEAAPWTLVEADNKRFARVKVLKTLCERLEAALE